MIVTRSMRALAVFCLLLLVRECLAQPRTVETYPARTVTLVVPFVAGSATDVEARFYTPKLSEALKQPVLLDYRPAAATRAGSAFVAKAAPDGYTLLIQTATFSISGVVGNAYDPVRDFSPISMLTDYLNIVSVSNTLPVRTIPELIAHARANPGKVNHATLGMGGSSHIAGGWLYSLAGVKVTYVPYKGSTEIWTDMMRGETHVMITGPLGTGPLVKAGKIRAIAVTSQERSPYYPGVPTVKETYPPYVYTQWSGILAPAKTPPAIVHRLNEEFARVVRTPEVTEKLVSQARNILLSTPEYFEKRLIDEVAVLRVLVKDLDIREE